jgi:AcrR family transcriptional regulator
MRSDARRNYERLVAVARAAFARDGPGASLEAIARDAGVGSATLHRHFPHRYALMEAALWSQIESVCAQGRAEIEASDPTEALVRWLRAVIDLTAERGLASALVASRHDEVERLFDACHTALREVGDALWQRALEDGGVRQDIDLDDVLRLVDAIALAVERDDDRADRADRLLDVVVRGIGS